MKQITRRAQKVIEMAKQIAREYEQAYVGTEHLLLAIIREGSGSAARALVDCGVTEANATVEIDKLLRDRLQETWIIGRWPGTPHFRDVLSKASHAARGQGNWQICSLHLLMALLAEKDSIGYKTLRTLGVTGERLRECLGRTVAAR